MGEGVVDVQDRLNVGGKDLGMLPQISEASVTAPLPDDFNCFKEGASKQVKESGADPDSVALQGIQPSSTGCVCYPPDAGVLGQRP